MHLLGLFINILSPGQRELIPFSALNEMFAHTRTLALAHGEEPLGVYTTFPK